jgi:hypothetical protein
MKSPGPRHTFKEVLMRLKPGQQRPKKHRGPKYRYFLLHPDYTNRRQLPDGSGEIWSNGTEARTLRGLNRLAGWYDRTFPGKWFELWRTHLAGKYAGLTDSWEYNKPEMVDLTNPEDCV